MNTEDIPHFETDGDVFNLMMQLNELKSKVRCLKSRKATTALRKVSRIKSINSSLSIEGNELNAFEVSEIINDRQVIGSFDEIVEVKNAISAYDMVDELDSWSVSDFLKAHDMMMFGLVETPGFREGAVGVFDGDRLIYKLPEAKDVEPMLKRLFEWASASNLPVPIIGAIVHYYIETIHPFPDGNGRMGRLWNTKILREEDEIYNLVSVETYIQRNQKEYYEVLEESEGSGMDCTGFVKFSLSCMIASFTDLLHLRDGNMERLLSAMGGKPMSLKEIMAKMGLRNRGSFMEAYLNPAIRYGFIIPLEPARSKYQKYKKILRSGVLGSSPVPFFSGILPPASGTAFDHELGALAEIDPVQQVYAGVVEVQQTAVHDRA